jgi:hypothetical protein
MKVTDVWFITREDGTEYTKTFFDNGYTSILEKNETRFLFITPAGRKCTSDAICYKGIKAINTYCDQVENV